jgi:uracil-DNA glycosylase
VTETVAEHMRAARARETDDWSEFADSKWLERPPGTARMQRRVLHLLDAVGLEARRVPASNVVFVRTARERDLANDKRRLLNVCWPVHAAVIERLGVRVVACMGGTVGRKVRKMLGADVIVDSWSEENERRWKSTTYRNPDGLQVVSLAHPSVADWSTSAADPSPLVRAALERAIV